MDKIFSYNPNANYLPNEGGYTQTIRDYNLYLQSITVSDNKINQSSFPITFENIFTKYIIDDHSDKVYKTWNDDGLSLWQTQLNFAIFCSTSACGVSTQHIKTSHPLINSIYKFHIYYQTYRILKRMKVALPFENGFNRYNNKFDGGEFVSLCREFNVSTNNDSWTNKNVFTSKQYGRIIQLDSDSYARWIIEKSEGLTLTGISKISESAMMYVYLLLTSQASARSKITDKSASSIQAQQIWMDNFYNIIHRENNTANDIKMYQNALKYASSKVDYNLGENVYMIPSDMNLRIKRNIANYNNEIFISNKTFKLGYNININKKTIKQQNKKRIETSTIKTQTNKDKKKQQIKIEQIKKIPQVTSTQQVTNTQITLSQAGYFGFLKGGGGGGGAFLPASPKSLFKLTTWPE